MTRSLIDAAAFFDQTLHEPHDGPALADCKRKLREFLYTTPEGYRHDCLSALRLAYGLSTDQQLVDFLHSLEIFDQQALTRTFFNFVLQDPLKSDQAIPLEQWLKDCAARKRELEIDICGEYTNPMSPAEREEALFDDQDGPDTPPEQAPMSPQAEPTARATPATPAADPTASVQISTQADSARAPQVAKPADARTPLANAHKPDKAATPHRPAAAPATPPKPKKQGRRRPKAPAAPIKPKNIRAYQAFVKQHPLVRERTTIGNPAQPPNFSDVIHSEDYCQGRPPRKRRLW
jgi:hypothetical protein